MVLILIFRGYTITNLILDLNSVRSTPKIKSLNTFGIGSIRRFFKSWEKADNFCNLVKLFDNVLKKIHTYV